MKKNKSIFFKFKNEVEDSNFSLSEFKGWNGSIVLKVDLPKNSIIKNDMIVSKYFNIFDKEKIIVTSCGQIEFKSNDKNFLLNEFDALNIYSNNSNYEIKSLNDSQFYVISAIDLKPQKKDPILFNFIKDIVPKDIWGGQCISRVFFGESLNMALFDLKAGFKFHDDGHSNEQITWVVKGEMEFYVKDLKDKLLPGNGVDIGSYDVHGGISNGAIGFDVFYPKRDEGKYK